MAPSLAPLRVPATVWLGRIPLRAPRQRPHLPSADNPDGEDTSPAWLSGPGPINFWHTHFQRTLHDANEAGRTHIMVVNTQTAYGLDKTVSGMHWFLVAWKVDGARMIDPHGESP